MTTYQKIVEQALKRIANPDWEWQEAVLLKIAADMLPTIPHPDLEASRLYWDETLHCVKHEIVPITDMYKYPSNKSDNAHDNSHNGT